MKNWRPKLYVMTTMLALSVMLLSCDQGNGRSHAALAPFDRLVADPERYAGQYVCTEGVHVDGFEISGLGATAYQKDGYPRLMEPVIWLEEADFQSRGECIRTNTTPSFEFCQAVVCGVFEIGGGYGHGGGYAYRLRGHELSALPTTTLAAAGRIQIAVSPIL
jgi:hypothetical protein